MSAPITLIGRCGTEPEIKSAKGPVVTFRVVTNGRRNIGGEWQDVDTSWWSVVTFGFTAEGVIQELHKGDLVVIVGKVKETSWEKDGVKHKSVEVVADHVAKELRIVGSQGRAKDPAVALGMDTWSTTQEAF
jgi:single-strand DNA-binding protein